MVVTKNIKLSEKIKSTPEKPGVYLMKDISSSVLYVGKALNLRNRIKSYFSTHKSLPQKTQHLVKNIHDFDLIFTATEQEALILENNMIKWHQPKFNARLKDDKSYPFIKINLSEEFPQIYFTRKIQNDGARYFGPFASAKSVRNTLTLLKKLFPYRSCTKEITGQDTKACLDFHIQQCMAPCIGNIDKSGYLQIIDEVILFLEGNTSKVTNSLTKKMQTASKNLEFEKAAIFRNQLESIELIKEKQKVVQNESSNFDSIAITSIGRNSWIEIFFIRQGKLIGQDNFTMNNGFNSEPNKILKAFIMQFYEINPYIPPEIFIQTEIEDMISIENWLSIKKESKVSIKIPLKGNKQKILYMALENSKQRAAIEKSSTTFESKDTKKILKDLQEILNLPNYPERIECYDISNISGTNSVASMAVFQNGKPAPNYYKKFKIKSVKTINDYAMIKEVLRRRFKSIPGKKVIPVEKNQKNLQTPDLVLIDGGKGHLSSAVQVFLELGINNIPLASIAKQKEEIFVPNFSEPVEFSSNFDSLNILQKIRDEAHRFAINYHKNLRSKTALFSAIDTIPGIGPKKRKVILNKFGSIKNIKKLSIEEITETPGISRKLAEQLSSISKNMQ
ncbi:MAG: excinuclease ABC subunit UvrC [SAR202 cluster bacterium]|nr:excinuclease ABC subunit UvrC [SAR202 cluster bacterium]